MRRVAVAAVLLCLAAPLLVWALGAGVFGSHWGAGVPTERALPAAVVHARAQRQAAAGEDKQVLFGDLHVHTTFSLDAFMMALPVTGGQGARPVADACDFARFCSDLDFWSINDHAIGLTPRAWRETVDAIRQCNAVAGDPDNPDVVAFLGWEWTQFGTTPDNHYGHKNVVLRDLADGAIPTRPIAARAPADAFDRDPEAVPGVMAMGLLPLLRPSRSALDFVRFMRDMIAIEDCPDGVAVRELPADCRESTLTPAGLFAKLDDWNVASMVIPHGTTWGFYTPHGSSWDKQLTADMHDEDRQILIEVFSGHGNSEEFRPWAGVGRSRTGEPICPRPSADYLPSCWRAGEIIEERCRARGEAEAECGKRAAEARQRYVAGDVLGHLTVPGVEAGEWLDSGQCRDCFQPAFNYRPRSSVQYIMGLRDFDDSGTERRFNFGFIASSDNHTGRPGTGYKEYARRQMTEARLPGAGVEMFGALPAEEAVARSRRFEPELLSGKFFAARESERAASFFLTGGLAAVHAAGRSRQAIWDALQRREVYGTSGPRILLWFDLLTAVAGERDVPMGGEARRGTAPVFRVRALGSFEQRDGCPSYAQQSLPADRLEHLCAGECYYPSDRRRRISRVELVRVALRGRRREPAVGLVDDPWKVIPCAAGNDGCVVEIADPEFAEYRRDVLYYVRAIEEPSLAVNADPLRCDVGQNGRCVETHPCSGDGDECLAETEERAWSSPILVRWQAPVTAPAEDQPVSAQ